MPGLPRILIVDDSRMVRVSLANQLKGYYDIREESDGEAAWQVLVLDHGLQAVISDLQMPKLDGFGLLERIRGCKLPRLQQLPFILVSGEESEEERQRAKNLGVSDFVTKGVGTTEILTRLDHLLALTRAHQDLDATREHMVNDPGTGLLTRKYLELQAAQALSYAARHDSQVSAMVLGFDRYAAVCDKLGPEVAEQIGSRLAKMLAGKIRREDSLGHFGNGQYAIISPGTPPATCAAFAERIRQAVEAAQVAAHGQRMSLTVSVGVAAVPEARVSSAGALLELAGKRMQEAAQAGGNRVVHLGSGQAAQAQAAKPAGAEKAMEAAKPAGSEITVEAPKAVSSGMAVEAAKPASSGMAKEAAKPLTLQQALELLAAGQPEAVIPHLTALGKQVAPLLDLLNKELELGLPLAGLKKKLMERARHAEARN